MFISCDIVSVLPNIDNPFTAIIAHFIRIIDFKVVSIDKGYEISHINGVNKIYKEVWFSKNLTVVKSKTFITPIGSSTHKIHSITDYGRSNKSNAELRDIRHRIIKIFLRRREI